MKNVFNRAVFFAICAALFFAFASCSNSTGGGGTNPTPIQLPTPVPVAATYTVTFNANDGSENPATVTQTFTENRAESLKSFSEMGFSKSGFYFAGWGTSADATESAYADKTEYTANANITLYALWSAIPVYSVNVSSEHGTVTLSQATGIEGTEISLSNTPAIGWQFDSYTVTAEDGTTIVVDNDKFTLPAQNVTVTANYTIIDYAISVNPVSNGTVTVSSTANYDEVVTITATPESDLYRFNSFVVTAADGTSIAVNGTGNTRTFVMPAQSVTISVGSESKYMVSAASIEGGVISLSTTSAFVGDIVTITVNPSTKYYVLDSITAVTQNSSVNLNGEGNTRTFVMPGQDVNVNAVLNFMFVQTPYNKIGDKTINGVNYDIVEFGDYPKTILPKDSSITVDESKSVKQGEFTYCLGSDGNLYFKFTCCWEWEYNFENKSYSDGSIVDGDARWFKVEPIKWRVLTTNFDHDKNTDTTGKKLLLAEHMVDCGILGQSIDRTPMHYAEQKNCYSKSVPREWLNSEFLNTAFESSGRSKILDTHVDNGQESTNSRSGSEYFEYNYYTCGDTVDKVFLLSVYEATMDEYGFSVYARKEDANRVFDSTDLIQAKFGGNFNIETGLRTPYYNDKGLAWDISEKGELNKAGCGTNPDQVCGYVPALCLE